MRVLMAMRNRWQMFFTNDYILESVSLLHHISAAAPNKMNKSVTYMLSVKEIFITA